MSDGTTAETLTVGKLYKVTNPTSEHFGKVGSLLVIDGRICWVEFIDFVGLHHTHSAYCFGASDVEPYVFEDTEPQALVSAVETEHAAHLDRLEHRTDALRANSAANRLLTSKNAEQLNALAQEAKELRSNAAQAEREIDRLTAQTKTAAEELWAQIERIDDKIDAQEAAMVDAMHYRRMVGNLFRRLAGLVDGG